MDLKEKRHVRLHQCGSMRLDNAQNEPNHPNLEAYKIVHEVQLLFSCRCDVLDNALLMIRTKTVLNSLAEDNQRGRLLENAIGRSPYPAFSSESPGLQLNAQVVKRHLKKSKKLG